MKKRKDQRKQKIDVPLQRTVSPDWVEIPDEKEDLQLLLAGGPKHLKQACRKGLPSKPKDYRRQVWLSVTRANCLIAEDPDLYERHLRELFPKSKGSTWRDIPQIPTFGSICDWAPHQISDGDVERISEMLCVLGHNYPSLQYCPLLVELIPIMINYDMNPKEIYAVCCHLITRSQQEGWYFQLTTVRSAIFSQTFMHILEAKISKLYRHMEEIKFDAEQVVNTWFNRLFVGYLPQEVVFRICDAYFCEGFKVLYRVALAIFKLFEPTGLECRPDFFASQLQNHCSDPDQNILMDTGFKFLLKRKSFRAIDERHDVSCLNVPQAEIRVLRWPSFKDNQSFVITTQQLYRLWCWLPERQRVGDLYRLYTSHDDGKSMISFLEKVEQKGPTILLIKDGEGNVFGTFLHNHIIRSLKPQSDRSLILFTLHPNSENYTWNQNIRTDVVTYFSTDKLYIGDSTSHAIYLPSDMDMGTTTRTNGFSSPPLCPSPTGDFECSQLEMWGFKDSILEDGYC